MNTRPNDLQMRELRKQELTSTEFAQGAQGGALMQPQNGAQLMEMANIMAGSGTMIREFYRGNPGDCVALIMICQPYGFNPFMVSWKTYKASKNADAPIAFEGQLVNAMVNMSAPVRGRLKYEFEGEGAELQCTVTGEDRETGEDITYTSPRLKDIPVKNSPLWKGDPHQQLGYYSARSWARRHFPELLLGVYTRDEIETASIKNVTPKAATGAFAARAAAARQDAAPTAIENTPEPTVGEVMPDKQADRVMAEADGATDELPLADQEQDTPAHWTDHIDLSSAFPGSDDFTDGVKARQAGASVTDCPHQDDHDRASDWIGGWHEAGKAVA